MDGTADFMYSVPNFWPVVQYMYFRVCLLRLNVNNINATMAVAQDIDEASDPEDILSTSLQTLYEYAPITHSSAGRVFTYTPKSTLPNPPTVTLNTPDTKPANWSLHASSIWVSSLYVAENLADLHLPSFDVGPKKISGRSAS